MTSPTPPSSRWAHQLQAMRAFLSTHNGVLEMATGSGKTRTALNIINQLSNEGLIEVVIVSAFGTDLLDQWYGELLKQTNLRIYRAYAQHRESLAFINDLNNSVLLISLDNLDKVLTKLDEAKLAQGLLVCDEVHRLGSTALVKKLAGRLINFRYRLGLSATPDRTYDQVGNEFIQKEIGPTIFRFGLREAIERGVLCEMDYIELRYFLSPLDRADVRAIIRSHYAKIKSGQAEPIETLYRNISRVRKLTKEKIQPFREFVSKHPDILKRCIIFVETAEYGALVQKVLMEYSADYHTYYQDDDRKNLQLFAEGSLKCLVTCHRISEGIDIHSVNNIVLFSSSRARLETIQRLGRCLRTDPNNPLKKARVIDFIEPSLSEEENQEDGYLNVDEERREWFLSLAQIKTSDLASDSLQVKAV
ncbi:helicase-like protein [Pseudomonas sp. WCS365]|uniref:DEAD/DEAH box helicase n=1 Tax=Pseudomonas sp. WCS365 TaxID=2054929 RepID=UPI000C22C0F0|nr:DEAD/DEAH box helicase family protein [Pseudomonas sp. WCS365]PJH86273.1 helicase-like protein [Pseudomonas sp. WCS365]